MEKIFFIDKKQGRKLSILTDVRCRTVYILLKNNEKDTICRVVDVHLLLVIKM